MFQVLEIRKDLECENGDSLPIGKVSNHIFIQEIYKSNYKTFPIGRYFVWDGQLVFMTERYRYASCALTIKNGNHLTASMCNSLLDEQHKNASHHSYSHNALS